MHSIRTCPRCEKTLAVNAQNFYFKRDGKPFGLVCRECIKARVRARKAADPEAHRTRQRERLSTPESKARKAASDRASYLKHRETRLAACTDYRDRPAVKAKRREFDRRRWADQEQRAELRQYLRGYHARRRQDPAYVEILRAKARANAKANPERSKALVRNRRARLRGAEGRHTAADVAAALERQNHRCFWCGGDISGGRHTVDHKMPIVRGGSNGPENIVAACAACNYAKGAKTPEEFRAYRASIAGLSAA